MPKIWGMAPLVPMPMATGSNKSYSYGYNIMMYNHTLTTITRLVFTLSWHDHNRGHLYALNISAN